MSEETDVISRTEITPTVRSSRITQERLRERWRVCYLARRLFSYGVR